MIARPPRYGGLRTLSVLKLRDVENCCAIFLGYDLLARRWVRYAHPFGEALAGLLIVAGILPWLSARVALWSQKRSSCKWREKKRSRETLPISGGPSSSLPCRREAGRILLWCGPPAKSEGVCFFRSGTGHPSMATRRSPRPANRPLSV